MTVAVVIPAAGRCGGLRACVESVLAQGPDHVVVADNGMDPAVRAALPPSVTVVTERSYASSYAARNAAVRAVRADVYAFTDADCLPAPGWLAALLAPGTDVTSGVISSRGDDGSAFQAYREATEFRQEVYAERSFGATGNLAVRRTVFEAVGLFDPLLVSSGDYELCRRAADAGFSFAYAPDAVVHHPPRSWREYLRKNRRLGYGFAQSHFRYHSHSLLWKDFRLTVPTEGIVARAESLGLAGARHAKRIRAWHWLTNTVRWLGNLEAIADYALGRPWRSQRVPGAAVMPSRDEAVRRAVWRRGIRQHVEHPRLP